MVDGDTVMSESIAPFEGRRRSPQRSLTGSFSVGPGHHVVVAMVEDLRTEKQYREETRITIEPGSTATLSIALRGPLKKRLRIELQN